MYVKLKGQYATTVNIPLNSERSVLPHKSSALDDIKHLNDGLTDTLIFRCGQKNSFKLTLPYLGKIEEVSLAVPAAAVTEEWRCRSVQVWEIELDQPLEFDFLHTKTKGWVTKKSRVLTSTRANVSQCDTGLSVTSTVSIETESSKFRRAVFELHSTYSTTRGGVSGMFADGRKALRQRARQARLGCAAKEFDASCWDSDWLEIARQQQCNHVATPRQQRYLTVRELKLQRLESMSSTRSMHDEPESPMSTPLLSRTRSAHEEPESPMSKPLSTSTIVGTPRHAEAKNTQAEDVALTFEDLVQVLMAIAIHKGPLFCYSRKDDVFSTFKGCCLHRHTCCMSGLRENWTQHMLRRSEGYASRPRPRKQGGM